MTQAAKIYSPLGKLKETQPVFAIVLVCALLAVPVIAVIAPRFMSWMPVAIGVLGTLAYRVSRKEWPALNYEFFFWPLVIAGLMAASILWSVNSEISAERTIKAAILLSGSAFFLNLIWSRRQALAEIFIPFLPFAMIAAGLFCLSELYFDAPVSRFFHDGDGPFMPARLNRGVIVFVLCFFVTLFLIHRSGWKPLTELFLVISICLIMLGIILGTESQSAHMAFFLGCILFVFFPYKRQWAWFGLFILFAAMLFATPWIAQFLFNDLRTGLEGIDWFQQGYAANRMEIWDFVSRRALESPIWGHGVEATRAIRDFDTRMLYHPDTHVLHPHNFAVQAWIEFGMIGALFAAAFFADMLRRIWCFGLPSARFLLPTFFAAIAVATTGYGLWQGWFLGMFMLLAALSLLGVHAATQAAALEKD